MEVLDYNNLLDCDIVTYLNNDVYDVMIVRWFKGKNEKPLSAYLMSTYMGLIDYKLLEDFNHSHVGIAKREFFKEFGITKCLSAHFIFEDVCGKKDIYLSYDVEDVLDFSRKKILKEDNKGHVKVLGRNGFCD